MLVLFRPFYSFVYSTTAAHAELIRDKRKSKLQDIEAQCEESQLQVIDTERSLILRQEELMLATSSLDRARLALSDVHARWVSKRSQSQHRRQQYYVEAKSVVDGLREKCEHYNRIAQQRIAECQEWGKQRRCLIETRSFSQHTQHQFNTSCSGCATFVAFTIIGQV